MQLCYCSILFQVIIYRKIDMHLKNNNNIGRSKHAMLMFTFEGNYNGSKN